MKQPTKTVLANIGAGFSAFLVVRLIPHITGQHQDIRPFIVTTFAAFTFAVLSRTGRSPRWSAIATLASSGIIPGIALRLAGISLTANIFFAGFLTASLLGLGAGTAVSLMGRKSLLIPLCGASALIISVIPIAYGLVPRFLDDKAYQLVDLRLAPFSLNTLDGRTLDSSTLRGHVVVLSFWATWCLPCQEELPKVEAVAKDYAGRPDVMFVAVNSGTEGDTLDKVREYALRRKLALPIAVDSLDGESKGQTAKSLNVPSLPAVFILDQRGDLRVVHIGYEASEHFEQSLKQRIDRLL